MQKITIHWFRRDLRLDDNAALYQALKNHKNVLSLFIFDSNILDDLEDKDEARVTFIYDCIIRLHENLKKYKSSIIVRYGKPAELWKDLLSKFKIEAVYTNHDYEPYAIQRDDEIKAILATEHIPFKSFKDQVIFEKDEVLKPDNKPYTVFSAYRRTWFEKLNSNPDFYLKPYPTKKYFKNFLNISSLKLISLDEMGFIKSKIKIASQKINKDVITNNAVIDKCNTCFILIF